MRTRLMAATAALTLLAFATQGDAQDGSNPPGYAGVGLEGDRTVAAMWQESPFEEEAAGAESNRGGGYDSGGYDSGGCDSCWEDSCGECGDCCDPCGCGCGCGCPLPGWQVFGDYLFLRPRNAEIVYAVPFNGPIDSPPAVPIQVGRTAVVDYGYESGFRAGLTRAFDDCANLGVTYTTFESNTSDDISIDVPYVIRSMVSHPSTWTATADGLDASAEAGIDFDLIDLDYRSVFLCGPHYSMNYLVGLRYAYLEQDFRSQFAINGRETVSTDIRFDGGGIRLGLEGERYFCGSRLMVYGRGTASFVVGEFNASYAQGQAFDASVVDTGWSAGRVVPIMDLEVGIGWTSRGGRLRLTTGYMISAWYNTVKTDDFIESVRANDFVGLGDKLTFDGLTSRIELRY